MKKAECVIGLSLFVRVIKTLLKLLITVNIRDLLRAQNFGIWYTSLRKCFNLANMHPYRIWSFDEFNIPLLIGFNQILWNVFSLLKELNPPSSRGKTFCNISVLFYKISTKTAKYFPICFFAYSFRDFHIFSFSVDRPISNAKNNFYYAEAHNTTLHVRIE